MNVCGTCRYNYNGTCTRYPPVMVAEHDTAFMGWCYKTVFPPVDIGHPACGEYKGGAA